MDTEKLSPSLQKKVNLAAQRGTRVVIVRTIDTHFVLDITRQADRVLNYLRKNLFIKFKPEEVVPLMEKYYKVIQELSDVTEELCNFVGVKYKPPRKLKGEKENEENQEEMDNQSTENTQDE